MNHVVLHDVRAGFLLMVGLAMLAFHLCCGRIEYRDASGSVGRSQASPILNCFLSGPLFRGW